MIRILRNSVLTVAAVTAVYWVVWLYDTALRSPRFFDGWILCAAIGVQVLFHLRKSLPALRLGAVANSVQAHLYIGYFSIAVFLFHTDFSLPASVLNWALWLCFVSVTACGVLGTYLSWSVPAKLEGDADTTPFETIPALRAKLARRVDALVRQAGQERAARQPLVAGMPYDEWIADFHANRLQDYLARPRNLLSHLRGSRRPLKRLCDEIERLERYLDKPGKKTLRAIRALVVAKDGLDYRYAHQRLQRAWLFVHIPATYGLVVLMVVHVAINYAYSSGVP